MAILALIGIAALCWIANKFFNNIGKCFDALSHDLTDRFNSKTISERKLLSEIKKVKEKINTIKGNGTDQEFRTKVQKEIDDLCE